MLTQPNRVDSVFQIISTFTNVQAYNINYIPRQYLGDNIKTQLSIFFENMNSALFYKLRHVPVTAYMKTVTNMKKKYNTICVGHHHAQANTNDVSKTCALLQNISLVCVSILKHNSPLSLRI